MTTKAQRKAIVDEKISVEKQRILSIMRESDIYTSTFYGKRKDFQKHKNTRTSQVLLILPSIH